MVCIIQTLSFIAGTKYSFQFSLDYYLGTILRVQVEKCLLQSNQNKMLLRQKPIFKYIMFVKNILVVFDGIIMFSASIDKEICAERFKRKEKMNLN